LVALVLAANAWADTIYLNDGKVLSDVTVLQESLKEVTFREKGKTVEQKVPADDVLRIGFQPLPKAIDVAESLAAEGSTVDAIDQLKTLAESVLDGSNKQVKQSWAAAHALHRAIELAGSIGDAKKVVELCDILAIKIPNSRRTPLALLAKAEAQRGLNDAAGAQQSLIALRGLAQNEGLSRRWTVEADLGEAQADANLNPDKRRARYKELAAAAGSEFPSVASRARVLEGESWLEGEKKNFDKAAEIFQIVADDPRADDATLAAAFTGLGDCLFQEAQAAAGEQKAGLLENAVLAYLRVVVLYREQAHYAAKAAFFAGRVFDAQGTDDGRLRARRMYAEVIERYPASNWATQAKSAGR
jgi:hypothetical protein